ncbi:hypothetical protein OU800_04335 [Pseudomonas sp. GOM7]|uniref:hypothetical protein n=1 Tax=Pseudomonas sp. GOM7 TaxID=2998079 RepID=UPI00227CCE37|nr:hypothetical protein [Pseudomonas sp. GOM7]WAJ38473.1 hypothetical protein OU800_04335 [Pseudomonas sp. GOM7]
MQIIKLIDVRALALAFLVGVISPVIFIQLTLFALSALGSTNTYLEGTIPLYAVYFIAMPFLVGYMASRLAKQLPYHHGLGAVLILVTVAYAQSEPISWLVGATQLVAHSIAGVVGVVMAIRRSRA